MKPILLTNKLNKGAQRVSQIVSIAEGLVGVPVVEVGEGCKHNNAVHRLRHFSDDSYDTWTEPAKWCPDCERWV